MKHLLLTLCLLPTIGCARPPATVPAQAAQPTPVPQWEYRTLAVTEYVGGKSKDRTLSKVKLNELGAEGWELAGLDAAPNPVLPSARDVTYYLRRPKAPSR